MSRIKRPSRRNLGGRCRSRGAALVEFALVVPVVMMLVFGTIEGGFYLGDSNVVSRAVQRSARVGAGLADRRTADYETLRALETSLTGLRVTSVRRVIVFDAEVTADGDVPPSCLALERPDDLSIVGITGTCNVYSPTQLVSDEPSHFDGGCSGDDWDRYFCPTHRSRDGFDPDVLGVYIELDFGMATSYLPHPLAIRHSAAFQLEPCVAGDPSC